MLMVNFASVLNPRYNMQQVTTINKESVGATQFVFINNGDFNIQCGLHVFPHDRIYKQGQRLRKGGILEKVKDSRKLSLDI